MDRITLQDYRCFREPQSVRLAPLTLLVGENSTGKTAFLALIRALHECAYGSGIPDFKTLPFDLGSFSQIAFDAGVPDQPSDSFAAGFEIRAPDLVIQSGRAEQMRYEAQFRGKGPATSVSSRRFTIGSAWLEQEVDETGKYLTRFGTDSGEWQLAYESDSPPGPVRGGEIWSLSGLALNVALKKVREKQEELEIMSVRGPDKPSDDDWEQIEGIGELGAWHFSVRLLGIEDLPGRNQIPQVYAGGPIRSRPKRTYDPAIEESSPYGENVPSYLAALAAVGGDVWRHLKQELERVGKATGLFERLEIRQYGDPDAGPFQMLFGVETQEQDRVLRNLVDVGYGVGQMLPLVTELVGPEQRDVYLLQQPEVHLHPRAQAGLGSLFCELASEDRQLIVETHSDHLIDRVRMEVRDGTTDLKPEEVLVLYFERNEIDVTIHEIRFDELGNVCGAPETYRGFFMEETRRSLGL